MKKVSTVVLLVALLLIGILAAIALSYAWYNADVKTGSAYIIPANGFLVIEFDPDSIESGGALKPAVAMPDAVKYGRYTDPLRAYDENEAPISYVQEAATVVTYRAALLLYDYDISTTGIHDVQFNYSAKLRHPDYGDLSMSLEWDICMMVDVTVQNGDGSLEDTVQVENDDTITVAGNVTIYLEVTAYLRQVDDLSDLFIRDSDVILVLMATVIQDVDP